MQENEIKAIEALKHIHNINKSNRDPIRFTIEKSIQIGLGLEAYNNLITKGS